MWTRRSCVSSPSRNEYSSFSESAHSGFWSSTGCRLLGGQATFGGELVQRLLQRLSSAMQPTHHGTDRDVEDVGDLLVGEALDIGEEDGQPEVLGQRLDRLLDLGLREEVHELVLGAAAGPRLLQPTQAPVQVEVLDVVQIRLVRPPLLGPVLVDVGVGEDPVQPGLEVRALLEATEAP